jgi:hypothetical protein
MKVIVKPKNKKGHKKTAAKGKKAVDEGRDKKATRLLKKAARQETRSIKKEGRTLKKIKKKNEKRFEPIMPDYKYLVKKAAKRDAAQVKNNK